MFEQFEALYMHNVADKHLAQPKFEPSHDRTEWAIGAGLYEHKPYTDIVMSQLAHLNRPFTY